ncbi:hypothetical protein ACFLVW_06425 [Chloroflexota bacterium]
MPGLAFAVWTMANLVPRARAHHAWYHKHFPDYPAGRKVLVPRYGKLYSAIRTRRYAVSDTVY